MLYNNVIMMLRSWQYITSSLSRCCVITALLSVHVEMLLCEFRQDALVRCNVCLLCCCCVT
jgi:hypothetical protein